ncbi:P-loop containing nucleoside triphosphate hydrolase protein [Microdochium bolleyi]|uniref:DNA 3'-5' helicase n=1 Tax=Microdochium bolleyi TaxID=196109 RepID=A0A136IQI8_9PEZI|nr:P-loop containing nucleoside triphosphate hydrolase protein [Microdochium bolleyi]
MGWAAHLAGKDMAELRRAAEPGLTTKELAKLSWSARKEREDSEAALVRLGQSLDREIEQCSRRISQVIVRPFVNPLLHFTAVLAIDPVRARFRAPAEFTTLLADGYRQWIADGSYSPFSTLTRFMTIGKGYRVKEGGTARIIWEDGKQALRLHGFRIEVQDFRRMAQGLVSTAESTLDGLLYGRSAALLDQIRLDKISDTGSEPGHYHRERSLKWLNGIGKLKSQLLLLTHVWGGQLGRGPEITSVRYLDTKQLSRSVYVFDGQVMLVTDRDKAKSIRGYGRKVVRFLPERIGQLLVVYLVWLVPFEEMLIDETRARKPSDSLRHWLWKDGRKGRWGTEVLTKELKGATAGYLGVELGTSKELEVGAGDDGFGLDDEEFDEMRTGSVLVVVLPIGGGKSLLFMVPAVRGVNGGVSIVVVLFVALSDDLIARARLFGIDCVRWRSVEEEGREAGSLVRVASLVVVSADQASSQEFSCYADALRSRRLLRRIFIDECHTIIIDVGYRKRLTELRGLYRYDCPIIVEDAEIIRARTMKRNIQYAVTTVVNAVQEEIVRLVEEKNESGTLDSDRKGVIYCRSKKDSETLVGRIGCGCYYSGMETKAREEVLGAWVDSSSESRWITVTIGLGTGVDIAGISVILYAELPYGLVDYVQQTGRSGRKDGEVVEAVIVLVDEAGPGQ